MDRVKRTKKLEQDSQHPRKVVCDFTLDKLFLAEAAKGTL